MKVKDTRTFRDFYKSNVKQTGDTNRNPHFAGRERSLNENESEFGFFEMFHGPNGEMQNLLKTILEMARDSQALYEFMQNAVDAESSDFIMFHHHDKKLGLDYLIVLNNGKPFDLVGVLSILDIGASPKFGEAETIGQFGVGFKLAHRLVGEDAGLEELLKQNKGPILFSWESDELSLLANINGTITKVDPLLSGKRKNLVCESKAPWLFKILYTNFPCLPDEKIIDALHNEISDAFSNDELQMLKEVANICIDKTKNLDFTTGSLLVIPLHEKKVTEVTQHANADGLPLTAAILSNRKGHKALERVMLNDTLLESAPVEVLSFRFSVDELSKITASDDQKLLAGVPNIELDFCFTNPFSDANPFKGKPQFYLYFPMTEERHGFEFAIHCNAFSFTSARTALQDNTERNRLIFRLFTDSLSKKLKQFAKNDKEKFIHVYTSLILSQRGQNNNEWKTNRDWLEADLWQPLMKVVCEHIPVTSKNGWRLADANADVIIKNSNLPLEQWYLAGETEWFFWNMREDASLCNLAQEKLNVPQKNLIDIIQSEGALLQINKWLIISVNNAKDFLEEMEWVLQQPSLFKWKKDAEERTFWREYFAQLKLWWFKGQCYSANELSASQAETKVIKYGAITELERFLCKTSIILSDESLNDYPLLLDKLRERFQSLLPYLYHVKNLIETLNTFLCEHALFSVTEKQSIFSVFYQKVGTDNIKERIERLSPLKLFANKRKPGEVKPLSSLIGTAKIPQMLQAWCIREDESQGLKLDEYLAQTDEEIYRRVIVPYWQDIARQEATPLERVELFEYIATTYKTEMPTLPIDQLFFTENGLLETVEKKFFHHALSELSPEDYIYLTSAVTKTGLGVIPQKTLLNYYKRSPFHLSESSRPNLTISGERILLAQQEMIALLSFYNHISDDFFEQYCIEKNENNFVLTSAASYKNYFTGDTELIRYIQQYHHDSLLQLPEAFQLIDSIKILKEKILFVWLIERLPAENTSAKIALVEILEKSSDDEKIKFLQIQEPFNIETEIEENSLQHRLLHLCFTMSKENRDSVLNNLVYLVKGEVQIKLSNLTGRGSDELKIQNGEQEKPFSIAALLDGAENMVNNTLTVAAKKWVTLGISSVNAIEHALGIYQHRNVNEVFEALCLHCDNIIQNGIQLAFVLLYGMQNEKAIESLNVNTIKGPKKLSGATLYLHSKENCETLPADVVLTDAYAAVRMLLSERNRAFAGGITLCVAPYIDISGTLVLPGITHLAPDKQITFLIWLQTMWLHANKPVLLSLPVQVVKLIGLEVCNWVLEQELALPAETIPYATLPFDEDEQTEMFLIALGAQGPNSQVCKARKHFRDNKNEPFQYQLNKEQAKATLFWLAQQKIRVKINDVTPLYNHWQEHNEMEVLPPLIGIMPGSEDFFIIVNYNEAIYIALKDLKYIQARGLRLATIANAVAQNIIAPIDCLKYLEPHLQKAFHAIQIKWEEINWHKLRTESREWNSPVYESWRKEQRTLPILKFYHGAIPKHDLILGNAINEFSEGDIAYDHHESTYFLNSLLREEELVNELITKYPNNANWQQLKTMLAAEIQEMQQLLALARKHPETSDLLNKFIDDIKVTEERQEKARLVNNPNSRYTLLWFQHLLDLVRAQEQKTSAPDITFSHCTPSAEGQGVYVLSETGGHIPSNIESFENINTEIQYRNEQNEVKSYSTYIQASYQYRQLKAIFPKGFPNEIQPEKIEQVKLTFSRTQNLIEALKAGYRRLNLPENTNLKTTLTPNVHFVFGPPGTGKTTTLAKRIIHRMEGEHSGPIIVLTPTNKAADVLVKKIIEEHNTTPDWLVRTGTCTDPEIIAAGIVQNNEQLVVNAATHKIIITTIHRFSYHKVRKSENNVEQLSLCDCPWSQVIFDEASMIPLAYIAFAIHVRQLAAPDTPFIVAGDPLQIPPVFDLIAEDLDEVEVLQLENIYTMVGLNSFDKAEQQNIPVYGEQDRIENLDKQHRAIPSIGVLFSKFQYNGKVSSTRGTESNPKSAEPRPLPDYFSKELGFKPITIIRYKVQPGETIYNPRKLNKSPLHLYSSLLVSELVKRFRQEVEKEKMTQWSLGILSPYRAQANIMGKLIDAHPEKSNLLSIVTDTVHGFQGDQNNMVIAVFNPSSTNAAYSRFLNASYIINVAISRAEDYLVLFIPDNETNGIYSLPLIKKLLAIVYALPKEQWCEFSAGEIEQKLMKQKYYFEEKTFTTSHQEVNVYLQPQLPYVIRLADNAVDIHLEQ